MALRIEDYAMIGDCRTAALVGRNGSIDWFCCPRFDSAACFASLLGTSENGRWIIEPREGAKTVRRRYRRSTLILETTLETETGTAELIDFMPIGAQHMSIIRLVKGVRGKVAFRSEIVFRFDYGFTIPWVSKLDRHTLTAVAGPDMFVLRSPVFFQGKDMRSQGRFTVHEGETVPFVLSYRASHLPAPPPVDIDAALSETNQFWKNWATQCKPLGQWSDVVGRSLVTLKGLTFRPTGGMVAAATTSLPEQLGGPRNWDYRYCWLRDATFTLLAFLNAGFNEEANIWQNWLLRAIAGSPDQMQTMYGVAGERRLPEWEIPWLAGYEQSKPVRVGNAAASQLQLDVYGELADVFDQAAKGGLPPVPRRREIRHAYLDYLERAWRRPDEGIWEIRGPRQHFTHSKVMTWVAFDRASKGASAEEDEALRVHWRAIADEIHADVCRNGVDADGNHFVQAYGSQRLDASLLLLAIVGFLPASDPRICNTIAAIEKRLVFDGFVLRYETESGVDGLPPGEGAFLACSFWLADNYLLQGRIEEAERLFERLIALCNDVGLLSEEYEPRSKRMLGNFPQAFSHVALVNTALALLHAKQPARIKPVERHRRRKAPPVPA